MLPQRPREVPPFPPFNPNIDAANKNHKHSIPRSTSGRIDRTSFSSVKESGAGGAQAFTDSKTSSYLRHEYSLTANEDAIDDSHFGSATPVQQRRGEMVGMLNPQSTLHGLVCPCDGFKGWKSISVGGKIASKSFGDLTKLRMRWDWDTAVKAKEEKMDIDGVVEKEVMKVEEGKYPPGKSALEMLPMELLGKSVLFISSHSWKDSFGQLLFGTGQTGELSAMMAQFPHISRDQTHALAFALFSYALQEQLADIPRINNRPTSNRYPTQRFYSPKHRSDVLAAHVTWHALSNPRNPLLANHDPPLPNLPKIPQPYL